MHSESVVNNEHQLSLPAAMIDFGGDKASASVTTRRALDATEQSANQIPTVHAFERGTGIHERSNNFIAASLDGRKVIRLLPAASGQSAFRLTTEASKMNSISAAGVLNAGASVQFATKHRASADYGRIPRPGFTEQQEIDENSAAEPEEPEVDLLGGTRGRSRGSTHYRRKRTTSEQSQDRSAGDYVSRQMSNCADNFGIEVSRRTKKVKTGTSLTRRLKLAGIRKARAKL